MLPHVAQGLLAMNSAEVGRGDIGAADDADDAAIRSVLHDGQGQKIVVHEQFQGAVQSVIRLERQHVVTHQIRGQEHDLGMRRPGCQMDFLQVDDSQQSAVLHPPPVTRCSPSRQVEAARCPASRPGAT